MHYAVFPEEGAGLCSETSERKGIWDRVSRNPGSLAPIIDREGIAVLSAKRSQINDLTMLPQDGNRYRHARQRIDAAVLGSANDLAVLVNCFGQAAPATGQR